MPSTPSMRSLAPACGSGTSVGTRAAQSLSPTRTRPSRPWNPSAVAERPASPACWVLSSSAGGGTAARCQCDRCQNSASHHLKLEADAAGQHDQPGAARGEAEPRHEGAGREHLQQQQREAGSDPDDPVAHPMMPVPHGPGDSVVCHWWHHGRWRRRLWGGGGGDGLVGPLPDGPSSPLRNNCIACTIPPARADDPSAPPPTACSVPGQRLERPHVAIGDEIAQSRLAMLRRDIGDHLGGLGFGARPVQRAPRRRGGRLAGGPRRVRISACFSPSALRIAAWRWPSARATEARRSRSAVICRFIARIRFSGGSILRISTRLTFAAQGSVAPSRMTSSAVLIRSREESVASSSISPITARMLVIASVVSARVRLVT